MKIIKGSVLLLIFLCALGWFRTTGQSHFNLQYADEVIERGLSGSQDLNASIANIAPRFAVEFANEFRDTMLKRIPPEVDGHLGQLPARYIFESGDSNYSLALKYPLELINDRTPPEITGIDNRSAGIGKVSLVVTTDEYTCLTVLVGNELGSYPEIHSYTQFEKQHEMKMEDMVPGMRYYYYVIVADRSGNQTQGKVTSFTVSMGYYLPLAFK